MDCIVLQWVYSAQSAHYNTLYAHCTSSLEGYLVTHGSDRTGPISVLWSWPASLSCEHPCSRLLCSCSIWQFACFKMYPSCSSWIVNCSISSQIFPQIVDKWDVETSGVGWCSRKLKTLFIQSITCWITIDCHICQLKQCKFWWQFILRFRLIT